MTRRNKWRIVSLMGVAFCAYASYLGADEPSDAGEVSDGIYRVKEPGGEWVVGIPRPEGYGCRGAAQWTEEAARPLVWWATVESKEGDIAACCSCDAYFNAHFDANCGRMVQPFDDPETLAENLLGGVGNALGFEDLEIEDARYVDTDMYDALSRTLRSMGVLQQRGEVRLTYSGEKQSVVDPQTGNPVRVDRAENTYFDALGRPVQMSDDQLRDWSRRNGGGAVDARERFEYANPHLRRAEPAQED